MSDDTIAAIATPLGEGGLGVVRLSGPAALNLAGRIFRASNPLPDAPSHSLHHGYVMDGGHSGASGLIPRGDSADPIIDEAVAAVFRAPRSYTGEDVVEISCHGGSFLLKRVLGLCLSAGARLAEPGEFTRRAFLNGKMDLAQAEAVADLIAARSEAMRRAALDQLHGRLSDSLRGLRRRILDLLARLEAGLDFAEDEVPDLPRAELEQRLREVLGRARALLATAPHGRLLREGLRAALAGRPNVGKSSLFNALLQADRAIVTDAPGTTRDVLEERVLMEGVPVTLTDTAGLREGSDAAESEGVRRARQALAGADVVLLVLDAAMEPDGNDADMARSLAGRRAVAVLNKCDRWPELEIPGRVRHFRGRLSLPQEVSIVPVSALTGRGLEDLRRSVLAAAETSGTREPGEEPVVTSLRHEQMLREAESALEAAGSGAADGTPEEAVALDLRRALDRLGRITGENADEEVLDAVFSKFCIGK